MRKRIIRMLGILMLIVAFVFVIFALWHPERSFPWSNTVTWTLYGCYVLCALFFLLVPMKQ